MMHFTACQGGTKLTELLYKIIEEIVLNGVPINERFAISSFVLVIISGSFDIGTHTSVTKP